MRYAELIFESSDPSIEEDIKQYLLRMKAQNMDSIPTSVLVSELNNMSQYDGISAETIVNLLQNKAVFPFVVNVSSETIDLSVGGSQINIDKQANRDAVKKLAKTATDKRM